MRFERAAINGDGRCVNSGLCPSDHLAAAVAFLSSRDGRKECQHASPLPCQPSDSTFAACTGKYVSVSLWLVWLPRVRLLRSACLRLFRLSPRVLPLVLRAAVCLRRLLSPAGGGVARLGWPGLGLARRAALVESARQPTQTGADSHRQREQLRDRQGINCCRTASATACERLRTPSLVCNFLR